MTTQTMAISYEVEVEEIKSEYSGAVEITCKEADYQKRRDEEQAGINWSDETPAARLSHMRILRAEPRHFTMTLTKDEARGFGIGARLRVSAEVIA